MRRGRNFRTNRRDRTIRARAKAGIRQEISNRPRCQDTRSHEIIRSELRDCHVNLRPSSPQFRRPQSLPTDRGSCFAIFFSSEARPCRQRSALLSRNRKGTLSELPVERTVDEPATGQSGSAAVLRKIPFSKATQRNPSSEWIVMQRADLDLR